MHCLLWQILPVHSLRHSVSVCVLSSRLRLNTARQGSECTHWMLISEIFCLLGRLCNHLHSFSYLLEGRNVRTAYDDCR